MHNGKIRLQTCHSIGKKTIQWKLAYLRKEKIFLDELRGDKTTRGTYPEEPTYEEQNESKQNNQSDKDRCEYCEKSNHGVYPAKRRLHFPNFVLGRTVAIIQQYILAIQNRETNKSTHDLWKVMAESFVKKCSIT